MERLSVVVPVVDEEAALPDLLARLLPARAAERRALDRDRADEVVVADGASSDGSRATAAAAGARVVEAPRGRGSQLRAGARASTGELLLFLHADCLPLPGALAVVRAAFEREPALEFAGLRQRIESRGLAYRLIERAADGRVRRGLVYGDSGLVVRRAAYERAGGFAALRLFEDVELSRRLRAQARDRARDRGCGWRLLDEAELAISARRWREHGVLGQTLRNWALTLAYKAGVAPERLARHYPAATARPAAAAGAERPSP